MRNRTGEEDEDELAHAVGVERARIARLLSVLLSTHEKLSDLLLTESAKVSELYFSSLRTSKSRPSAPSDPHRRDGLLHSP